MRRLLPAAAATLAISSLASPARSQSRYDMYGDPVDVSVQSLADNPESYDGRAVRVKGRFELATSISQRGYFLRESVMAQVYIYPVQEIAGQFEEQALRYSGREVEVTGVFKQNRNMASGGGAQSMISGAIMFWEWVGPQEEVKGDIKANLVPLESLVNGAGRYDGKTIRVYGRFRGKNLYGDLPSRSQRQSRDWVVKDDLFAIWITGRKPKGSGFELDINLKRDTEKWIQVVGVPETIRGVTYLRAMQVTLGKPAEDQVAAATGAAATPVPAPLPTPPPPPRPPVVVFALPLDGEADVPPNGRFQIQFSKDMDEASFKGRVVIRYAPPARPGDRDLDGAKMSYDGGRKALAVDPGDLLRPGREVQILLLPGIVDIEGQELAARPGRDGGPLGATDFLRFQVVTASLFGSSSDRVARP